MAIIPEDILFEDNDFILINKTGFQPTVPDKSGDLSILEDLEKMNKLIPGSGPVHRLDRPVIGLVLFAKTKRGTAAANRMLQERSIRKIYLAVVENIPPENEGKLKDYLIKQREGNKSRVVNNPGKNTREAVLKYKVIGYTEKYTMVRIELITGRHHQIRAQFSHIGCPVKGDIKYGARRTNREGGIMLFAGQLDFTHPFSGERLTISAPLPSGVLWDCFPHDIFI